MIYPLRSALTLAACVIGCSAGSAQNEPPAFDPSNPPRLTELVVLEPVPEVPLAPSAPLTPEEAAHIRSLIDDLASIDKPDFGLSSTLTGQAFAPVPQLGRFQMGLITSHNLAPSGPLVELVKLGPRAMPMLLQALTDARPTKLQISHERGFGRMWFDREITANPVNAREWQAIQDLPGRGPFGGNLEDLTEYQVTIGDVCFVIVGQIVGRPYSAVRYQPTACIVINSPTHDPKLAAAVSAAWSGPDPSRLLLDSLLLDLCSRGKYGDQEGLDWWYYGSQYQVSAVARLLYYFPDQAATLVVRRLDGLNVQKPDVEKDALPDAWMKQTVANGVNEEDYIDAVSWCDHPAVRLALDRLAERSGDPDLSAKCRAGRPVPNTDRR